MTIAINVYTQRNTDCEVTRSDGQVQVISAGEIGSVCITPEAPEITLRYILLSDVEVPAEEEAGAVPQGITID